MLSDDDLYGIFYNRAARRIAAARNSAQRFAYYTNGATARDVLVSKHLWMRLPSCMNDFSEVQHGRDLFLRTWETREGNKLRRTIDAICPGVAERLIEEVRASTRLLFAETFIACVSEHDDDDDMFGRLSMWRAYGPQSGVALVFDGDIFAADEPISGAYFSPVEYLTDTEFAAEFEGLANRLELFQEQLQAVDRAEFFESLTNVARLSILCVKHPAFKEEREWRIFSWGSDRGDLLRSIEVIAGVPQPVLKLPLANPAKAASVFSHLHRVLVGPTPFPVAVCTGLVELLRENGINDAEDRVWPTGVPLRQPS